MLICIKEDSRCRINCIDTWGLVAMLIERAISDRFCWSDIGSQLMWGLRMHLCMQISTDTTISRGSLLSSRKWCVRHDFLLMPSNCMNKGSGTPARDEKPHRIRTVWRNRRNAHFIAGQGFVRAAVAMIVDVSAARFSVVSNSWDRDVPEKETAQQDISNSEGSTSTRHRGLRESFTSSRTVRNSHDWMYYMVSSWSICLRGIDVSALTHGSKMMIPTRHPSSRGRIQIWKF